MGGAGGLVDIDGLQMDVARATQGEGEHAGGDGVVRHPVDQDEAAGFAVVHVGVEGDGFVQMQGTHADFVELKTGGGKLFQRVDIDLVANRADFGVDRAGPCFQQIAAAGQEGFVRHPDDRGFKLVGHAGRGVDRGNYVAARDVDFVGQGKRDGLADHSLVEVAIGGDDARHGAFAPRGLNADALARADEASGDRPGKAAKIEIGPVDPLHRQAERRALHAVGVDFHRFEIIHQIRAAIPGHVGTGFGDVVTLEGG